jgi:hypothetical protein
MPAPLSILICAPGPAPSQEQALAHTLGALGEAVLSGLIADVTLLWTEGEVPDWVSEVAEETGADCVTGTMERALSHGKGAARLVIPADVVLPQGWIHVVQAHLDAGGGAALFGRRRGWLDPLRARIGRPAKDQVRLLPTKGSSARYALLPLRTRT